MSTLRLYGDTSGYNDIKVPAVADNSAINLGNITSKVSNNYLQSLSFGITTPYDAIPAYGNDDYDTIKWNSTEHALELSSSTDTTIGLAFPAFRVDSGSSFDVTIYYKGSAASASGFYVRIYEYNSDLPSGKTHISATATNAQVQENTSGRTNFKENSAIGTDWSTESYTYTPTSGAKYASIVILNWAGHGTDALYLLEPKVKAIGGATGAAGVFSDFSGNSALALRYNFSTSTDYNTGGFTVATTGIHVPSDGYYDCYVNLYMTSTVQRPNIGLRFYINATVQDPISASNYIRSQSGHNEASTNLRMILYMTTGQAFRIGTEQLAAAGTVTITGANSNWIIQKVG